MSNRRKLYFVPNGYSPLEAHKFRENSEKNYTWLYTEIFPAPMQYFFCRPQMSVRQSICQSLRPSICAISFTKWWIYDFSIQAFYPYHPKMLTLAFFIRFWQNGCGSQSKAGLKENDDKSWIGLFFSHLYHPKLTSLLVLSALDCLLRQFFKK